MYNSALENSLQCFRIQPIWLLFSIRNIAAVERIRPTTLLNQYASIIPAFSAFNIRSVYLSGFAMHEFFDTSKLSGFQRLPSQYPK